MKEKYIMAEMDVITFEEEDVICTSNGEIEMPGVCLSGDEG